MTRESMIKVLRYKAEHIKTKVTPKFFLEVADALEQQPCEYAISQEDALKALDYDIKHFVFKKGVSKHMNEIANLLNTIYEIQSDNIKALPPVQPKPVECEDAISMMDLLNNLHKHFSKGFETDEWWNSTHVLQAVKDCRPELFDLNYVSSVQPKPKTGQWVLLDECSNSGYYCSECHKKLVKEGWSGTVKKIKYCPNCGAKMIESQESEKL